MEANRSRSRWTYAEFARLPSEEGMRYEVIAGEVAVTPSPATGHQRVVMALAARLHEFVRAQDLGEVFPGPVDVLFADGDYLAPDLVVVGKERAHLVSDRGIEGPPHLVVEVASPSTADRDRGIKLERYRLYGVDTYWIVDPDRGTVEVWELLGGPPEPLVLGRGEVLMWTPFDGQAVMELPLDEVLGTG